MSGNHQATQGQQRRPTQPPRRGHPARPANTPQKASGTGLEGNVASVSSNHQGRPSEAAPPRVQQTLFPVKDSPNRTTNRPSPSFASKARPTADKVRRDENRAPRPLTFAGSEFDGLVYHIPTTTNIHKQNNPRRTSTIL